jgi:hypothetical protein
MNSAMPELITSFAGTAAALTFWEIVKQVGVRYAKAYVPSVVVTGLQVLDKMLPSLIEEGVSGAEVEDRLRAELGKLTDSEWQRIDQQFSVKVFLDSLKQSQSLGRED